MSKRKRCAQSPPLGPTSPPPFMLHPEMDLLAEGAVTRSMSMYPLDITSCCSISSYYEDHSIPTLITQTPRWMRSGPEDESSFRFDGVNLYLSQDEKSSLAEPHALTRRDMKKTLSQETAADGVVSVYFHPGPEKNRKLERKLVTGITVMDPQQQGDMEDYILRDSQGNIILSCSSLPVSADLQGDCDGLTSSVLARLSRCKSKVNKRLLMRQYGYNSTTVDPMGMYIHQVNSSKTASKQWKSVKVRTECPLYEDQASPNIQDHEIVKEIGSLIGKHLMDSVCGTKEDKLLLEQQRRTMAGWEKEIGTSEHQKVTIDHSCLGVDMTHTSCVVSGNTTTAAHKDDKNTSSNWGGAPDKHICLTDNPNTGFLVVVPDGEGCCKLVIISQRAYNCTFFYAADLYHGAVHIRTYLHGFRQCSTFFPKFLGNKDSLSAIMDPCIKKRVFISYYSKAAVPILCHTLIAHKILRKHPRSFEVTKTTGELGLSKDRAEHSVTTDYTADPKDTNLPVLYDSILTDQVQTRGIHMK